ncbi:MAG: 1-(5-phosphoribosyl)-5-[(5-phosphoribosylamino)methylideneamino]imidazole-4-carboxamide isomerase [Candidatus Omnitrophica bacterium]|nr:1-(5-phosphoribosyl)-5-[(5-phosphoribosylamino)methylideneamino]imidazole-4-carboxamide isomerase [Candidatus Omnitrophota bacterium]
MIIFPAIDIKDGKVVRLVQGKFDQVTEYGRDPVVMARFWETEGAEWLHIVDLDGAKDGVIRNKNIILQIARTVKIPIEMGGGIRTKEDIKSLIDGGVSRVILGTKVIQDLNFLKEIVGIWGDKIAVSLDCHNGMVAQHGWVSTSDVKATVFAKELEQIGVKWIIFTDIARDGMMTGPNMAALEAIAESVQHVNIIASGGVSSLEDLKQIKTLELKGVVGAITGKAIYEGKIDLKKATQEIR